MKKKEQKVCVNYPLQLQPIMLYNFFSHDFYIVIVNDGLRHSTLGWWYMERCCVHCTYNQEIQYTSPIGQSPSSNNFAFRKLCNTPQGARWKLYNAHYTLHTTYFTVHTTQWIMHSVQSTVHTAAYTLYTRPCPKAPLVMKHLLPHSFLLLFTLIF